MGLLLILWLQIAWIVIWLIKWHLILRITTIWIWNGCCLKFKNSLNETSRLIYSRRPPGGGASTHCQELPLLISYYWGLPSGQGNFPDEPPMKDSLMGRPRLCIWPYIFICRLCTDCKLKIDLCTQFSLLAKIKQQFCAPLLYKTTKSNIISLRISKHFPWFIMA